MLRYGVFENFKLAENMLLVWGDGSLTPLIDLFRNLARSPDLAVRLDELPWMRGDPVCSVAFACASRGHSVLRLSRLDQATTVLCDVTAEDLLGFAEKVAAVAIPGGATGHVYLDVEGVHPIQIMVSIGEYPDDWPSA